MAEAFVRIKPDCVRVSPRPNAESVMRQLPSWIAHYNQVHHPHKALGYRSPREFIAAHEKTLIVSSRSGAATVSRNFARDIDLETDDNANRESTQACL
jgi:hypothetical protein